MRYLGTRSLGHMAVILRRLAVGASFCWAMMVGVLLGRTAEPAHEFLDKLRERKYYDHAQEYLERLPQSALATDEVKKIIPFELGVTLWAEAGSLREPTARELKLNAAQQKLNEFLRAEPEHSLTATAQSQLATISLERSTLLVARADRAPQEQDKLLDEARRMLAQAEKIYTASYEQSRDQLKKLQAETPSNDGQAIAKRDELRREWVQARLKLADVTYQKSKASIAGTADQKRFLENAAEQYASLADDFQGKVVGMQARVLEGVCYHELGNRTKAVTTFDNVLAVGDENDKDVRELKTKALRQALECWVKDAKYVEAVTRATPWLTKARGAEELEPDWLAGKFFLATAIERQLEAGTIASSQRTAQIAQARRFAQDVARVKGEYQSEATTLLAQLTKAGAEADKKTEKTAGTFEEANERVTAMLDEISALSLQISLAESSKDPDQLKQVADWKKQLADKQGGTIQNVRQALALSKSDSASKDVNRLRYTLAYLLFNQGEYYDAAVISEYVARHYPDFDLAQACGEIALKSYVRLYQTSAQEKTKRDFEAGKIGSVANFLMARWPTEPAAQEAVNWFLYLAVDRQQLDKATDLLDKLPADSPARSEAEIRIGRMLWSEYLKASRLKDDRPPQAELDKQLTKAQAVLESGVKAAMQRDSATPAIVDGVHALVQIYLDTSQADKAIPLLENEKIGPLTLVDAGHPATQREGVPFEIYRSALRAYITAQPPHLDAAAKVMDRLEQSAGSDAKASETLTGVYIAMGRDLQRQMEELKARKDGAGMRTIAQAMETFLKRIAARGQAANFSTLNWVADTFYSLGLGFDSGDGQPSTQARTYYKQAVQAYEQILAAVKKDPTFPPSPESLLGVRLRLAICRRGLGDPDQFKQAIADFVDLLSENPKVRVVQAEAAKTYQAWGARDPQYYKLAILGSNPDRKTGENTIWGWARIANILHGQVRRPNFTPEQQAEYRNWFHEARYQMCVCRFRHALAEQDKAEQKRQFDLTKTDIALTYQLYPDLGGDEWKSQYVALLKNVQKELGEKQIGLEAFDDLKKEASTQ